MANDGVVTLREAIHAANTDSPVNEAPAGDAADTITFDPDLFTSGAQTLTLAGVELAISDDLTLTGPGEDLLTIDANGVSRVFRVDDRSGSEMEVRLSGLTIAGGYIEGSGGGIYSKEHLVIEDSTISGNEAYTVYVDWGGGGVCNEGGTLEILGSTIAENRGFYQGGGILNYRGTTQITDTVIRDNWAGGEGSGVSSSRGGAVTITRCTIADNSGRGIYSRYFNTDPEPATLTVTESVITGNVGGIESVGRLTVYDSIVSNNEWRFEGGGIHQAGPSTIVNSTISGNADQGVEIAGEGTDDNVVAGNYLGTDVSGMVALGNGFGVKWGYGVAVGQGL